MLKFSVILVTVKEEQMYALVFLSFTIEIGCVHLTDISLRLLEDESLPIEFFGTRFNVHHNELVFRVLIRAEAAGVCVLEISVLGKVLLGRH